MTKEKNRLSKPSTVFFWVIWCSLALIILHNCVKGFPNLDLITAPIFIISVFCVGLSLLLVDFKIYKKESWKIVRNTKLNDGRT